MVFNMILLKDPEQEEEEEEKKKKKKKKKLKLKLKWRRPQWNLYLLQIAAQKILLLMLLVLTYLRWR